MTSERPLFRALLNADQVIVNVEQRAQSPTVLFEMLGGTVIRSYNIATPKEENIYLRTIDNNTTRRLAVSDLEELDTVRRLTSLIADFDDIYASFQHAERLDDLIQFGERRLADD